MVRARAGVERGAGTAGAVQGAEGEAVGRDNTGNGGSQAWGRSQWGWALFLPQARALCLPPVYPNGLQSPWPGGGALPHSPPVWAGIAKVCTCQPLSQLFWVPAPGRRPCPPRVGSPAELSQGTQASGVRMGAWGEWAAMQGETQVLGLHVCMAGWGCGGSLGGEQGVLSPPPPHPGPCGTPTAAP